MSQTARHATGSKRLEVLVLPDYPDATAEIVGLTVWPTESINLLPASVLGDAAEALRSGFSVRVVSDDPELNRMAAAMVRQAAGMR